MVTHEYPINMATKGSQSKHDNKYISHQGQHKIPRQTSNKELYSIMHLKKRDKEVHDHTAYTSHQGVIWIRGWYIVRSHQPHGIKYHGNDCSHIEWWHLHSTLKSGWKMEWSNGKSDYTIRFMAPNSVKLTVKFLNSDKVKLWGYRNILDSP